MLRLHLQINCNYLFEDLPCVAASIIRSFAQLPAFSLLWQRAMNFQRKLEFPPKIGFIVFRPSSLCTRSLHGFVQESFAGKSMIFTISPQSLTPILAMEAVSRNHSNRKIEN